MNNKKKIIVIADDFTGAAEIGGIGLRHGLSVAIETAPIDNNVDLLVIATDTRSMNAIEASEHITALTKKLTSFNPLFIYKKIDSVLRGNISEELVAQMEVEQKTKAIIIAANPIFDRIIKNGCYYIQGEPLNDTVFSKDSQYPIKSNNVLDILTPTEKYPIINTKPGNELPVNGLIMGDVENLEDLQKWTTYFDNDTLFAGASGFFDALLKQLQITKQSKHEKIPGFGKKALFVLGSYYPKDTNLLADMKQNGHALSNMPESVYKNSDQENKDFTHWTKGTINEYNTYQKVIISSLYPKSPEPDASTRIKQTVASLVKKVFNEVKIDEILIEGGSTASEILNILNIKKLTPLQELGAGVIRMKVDTIPGLCLTTKPGSYLWPESVWLPENIDQLNNQITASNLKYD